VESDELEGIGPVAGGQLWGSYTPRVLEWDIGRVSAHAWADCYQFRLVELRMSALSAVSVISQDCDDFFGTTSRHFPFQSQIQTTADVSNCHVS
jgi:hypothetical protein